MRQQWSLAGLMSALAAALLTPGAGQAQVNNWGFLPRSEYRSYYTPETISSRPVISSDGARVQVAVPANAEVWFNGFKTSQGGRVRIYQTPPIDPAKAYGYDVRARWVSQGKVVDRTRKVRVQVGRTSRVDFLREIEGGLQGKKSANK